MTVSWDWAALAALPLAVLGVGLVRRHALRTGIVDVPNARSSHRRPTPRGGGLGAVAAVLVAAIPLAGWLGASWRVTATVAIAVAAVAVVGWIDDRHSLAVRPRLAVHLGAGVVVGAVAMGTLATGWPAAIVAAWWLGWTVVAINVVNFMDGIDGLVGSQIAAFGLYAAALAPAATVGRASGLALAAGALGFLWWNWPPARIFLGDVGSGAFGVLAVVCGLAVMHDTSASWPRAFLPLLPLFLDGAVTLARRAARGERLTTAHREHLYQRLANGPWSHGRVSLAYLGVAAMAVPVGLPATSAGAFAALVAGYVTVVVMIGAALERFLRGVAPASDVGRASTNPQ